MPAIGIVGLGVLKVIFDLVTRDNKSAASI